MSRTHKPSALKLGGDFDVITGPPARSRPIPPAAPPKPEPAGRGAPPPSPEPGRKAKPTP